MLPLYWMHLIFSYTMVAVVLLLLLKKDEADAENTGHSMSM